MNDEDVIQRIDHLVDEEQALERKAAPGRPLTADEAERLSALEVALDQCWDLLRQRRARRNAGLDPDDAHVRPGAVVENYQQ
jgi:hypothetical protein